MPTFTYSPTEGVTIAPNGDISVRDGDTTTTYAKTGATKTVTTNPPDPNPPTPETPFSQKLKPNGDVIHTYADITKTPPVSTRVTFRPNGDVEILITIGQDRTKYDYNATTGVRRTRIWKDPDPEPETWNKTDLPKGAHSNGNGSSGGKKKSKKKVRRVKSAKRRVAKRRPQKKVKKKARRR